MPQHNLYSDEPADGRAYTAGFDRFYSRFAWVYDLAVKALPLWKTWLRRALPHIRGPRVLEVSFGTGYLLTQYARGFSAYGVDYNHRMAVTARKNLRRVGAPAPLLQGSVEALPYPSEIFDTLVNTMAFSGYPDASAALFEMRRVLKCGGRLVMIDINFPADQNAWGMRLANFWQRAGDLIRDMPALFRQFGFTFSDQEIGGWGSIHLYVAVKGG